MFMFDQMGRESRSGKTTTAAALCFGLMLSVTGCVDGPDDATDLGRPRGIRNIKPGTGPEMGPPTTEPAPVPGDVVGIESALTGCFVRSDTAPVASDRIIGEGPWGTWEKCFHYCPAGSFAYGMRLKSEPKQGSGDDTALNGIRLTCWNPLTGAFAGEIGALEGPWGNYLGLVECTEWEKPLGGGSMKIEGGQGSGDDTSANRVQGFCPVPDHAATGGALIVPPTHTDWGGNFGVLQNCPRGSAVCGLKTKVEASLGSGDDTALNGIAFTCCNWPL